ncbi:MAG TPA: c-type cytochrome [Oleiagrimonas sp.]|nr:c-type cytochrome [Oleiagrimonas sp.]
MKYLKGMIALIVVVVIAIAAWVWSGSYNIGADSPHWTFTRYVIGQLREHSIESRSADIKAPDLDDPALVAEGAHHYAEMCTGCHLAPGMGDSELREGLYPRPPNLTHFAPNPAEAFWIIKHGIKMTAMPAWGKTHDDQKIWAMVAYLQKQPHMSVERYRELAGLPAMAPVMMHASTSPATTGSAAPAMSAPMTVTPAAPSSATAPTRAASTH